MEKKIKHFVLREHGLSVESKPVFSFPIHSHSYYELTYYTPFDGLIRINGHRYRPDAPLVSLVVPSDFHAIEVEGGTHADYVKLQFDADILDGGLGVNTSTVLKSTAEDDGLPLLFREIGRKGDCRYSRHLLNAILCALLERGERVGSHKVPSSFSLLTAAIVKINAEYRESLTLTSVAAELGITPQYLSRLFCKSAGIGFSAYLARIRLEKAAVYLTETDHPVTEIAYEVGYRDLSHFMRSFKGYFGITPLGYRKRP